MGRMPNFEESGRYLSFWGHALQFPTLEAEESGQIFLRLGARMAPLKYHWIFNNQAPGVQSSPKTFGDFEGKTEHVLQTFAGISYGARARFYLPLDHRLLRWDDPTLDIQERDTANVEYEDSPIDDPKFNFWVAPGKNYVPAFDVENVLSLARPAQNINIQLMFSAAKYQYKLITKKSDPDLYEKLARFQIPSKPVSFGGLV